MRFALEEGRPCGAYIRIIPPNENYYYYPGVVVSRYPTDDSTVHLIQRLITKPIAHGQFF